jgi:HEAT repeat protein
MLDDLNEIDWESLGHAYGPAGDAPEALRALVSEDPERRAWAQDCLDGAILHQGTIYSATPRVLPFLSRLAADPTVPERHEILQFLAAAARSAGYESDEDEEGEEDAYARQCAVELARAAPLCLELLADPDPEVRSAAGALAALLIPLQRVHPEETEGQFDRTEILTALRARLQAEESRQARAGLLEALGTADPDAPELREELFANLAPDRDPLSRMTAALTLLREDAAPTGEILPALLDAAVQWEAVVAADRESGEGFGIDPGGLVAALRKLARQTPQAVYAPLLKALEQGAPAERRHAARTLGALLPLGIPSPDGRAADPPEREHEGAVVRALRRAAGEGDPSVRASAAAALLSRYYGGSEEVAVLVEAAEAGDEVAASIAVEALTAVGPAGAAAVPALIRRLEATQGETDVDPRAEVSLKHALLQVGRSLDSERLRLVKALLSMGPAAAPAAPLLLRLLNDPDLWIPTRAMVALTRIGPAAPEVLPALLRIAQSRSEPPALIGGAIEALTRFGLETEGVVETIADVLLDQEKMRSDVARILGEMGPGARAAVPALQAAFEQEAGTTRAELGQALARVLPRDAALPFLIRTLGLDDHSASMALWELRPWGSEAAPAVPAILRVLSEGDRWLRREAAGTLGEIGPAIGREAVEQVRQAVDDPDPEIAAEAARALRKLGEPRETWLPPLLRLLVPEEVRGDGAARADWARVDAAETLWEAGERPPEALQAVLEELENPSNVVRGRAASALILLGSEARAAMPRLREMLPGGELASWDPFLGKMQVAAAGALWAMGEQTPELLGILIAGLSHLNTESMASEVLARLGSAAAPAIPALEAVCEGRGDLIDAHHRARAREALEKIRASLALKKEDSG